MALQVLIVDDSASMRSIVRKICDKSGYEVSSYLESSNGKEALQTLSENWVDIVFLDLHMPVMDGLTFLKHVKEDDLLSSVPVVLVTTESRKETIDLARELGVRGHIKKPFSPTQLRSVLSEVL